MVDLFTHHSPCEKSMFDAVMLKDDVVMSYQYLLPFCLSLPLSFSMALLKDFAIYPVSFLPILHVL
jgi:hypothetical protein